MHQVADTVRNSLNFYRMQDSAETVERAVLTGPAVAIPGFAEALAAQLHLPVESAVVGDRRRASADAGRLTVAAGLALDDTRLRRPRHTMIGVTTAAGASLAGGLGLLLGSFLNVVAYRLPRGRVAVDARLALPRLRHADQAVRQRPGALVAAAARALPRVRRRRSPGAIRSSSSRRRCCMALTVVVLGADEDVWLGLAFVLLLVPVTVIDLDFRIIPNKLMIAGHGRRAGDPRADAARRRYPEHLIAAFAAGGFLLVAAIAYPAGHGHGRRQARVRHGPVPRAATSASRCSSRSSRARSSASRSWRARASRRAARRRSRSARSSPSAASSALLAGEPDRRLVPAHLRLIAPGARMGSRPLKWPLRGCR